jgi:hypothetical protein
VLKLKALLRPSREQPLDTRQHDRALVDFVRIGPSLQTVPTNRPIIRMLKEHDAGAKAEETSCLYRGATLTAGPQSADIT